MTSHHLHLVYLRPQKNMATVYISTGTNLGDRSQHLQDAYNAIATHFQVFAKSSIYETEPWGFDAEQNFYNQVIGISTALSAIELLQQLLKIEQELGRTRKKDKDLGYESRIIDLDILFYNQAIIEEDTVIIPHPKLHARLFVLIPLAELNPFLIHPVFGQNITQLIAICQDTNTPLKVYSATNE